MLLWLYMKVFCGCVCVWSVVLFVHEDGLLLVVKGGFVGLVLCGSGFNEGGAMDMYLGGGVLLMWV